MVVTKSVATLSAAERSSAAASIWPTASAAGGRGLLLLVDAGRVPDFARVRVGDLDVDSERRIGVVAVGHRLVARAEQAGDEAGSDVGAEVCLAHQRKRRDRPVDEEVRAFEAADLARVVGGDQARLGPLLLADQGAQVLALDHAELVGGLDRGLDHRREGLGLSAAREIVHLIDGHDGLALLGERLRRSQKQQRGRKTAYDRLHSTYPPVQHAGSSADNSTCPGETVLHPLREANLQSG